MLHGMIHGREDDRAPFLAPDLFLSINKVLISFYAICHFNPSGMHFKDFRKILMNGFNGFNVSTTSGNFE